MGTIRLSNGGIFDFNSLQNCVRIEDIAAGLSRACRYGGQLPKGIFYSVAEHSVLCVEEAIKNRVTCKDFLLCLLLHDASEAYCGDVVKPLKNMICKEYSVIEDHVQGMIGHFFHIDFNDYHIRYKYYDNQIYLAEVREIYGEDVKSDFSPDFKFWNFDVAETNFLKTYIKIGKM